MTGLVVSTRRASLSSKAPTVYVVHRAECARVGAKARPLESFPEPRRILLKARDRLNARPCAVCAPDLGV